MSPSHKLPGGLRAASGQERTTGGLSADAVPRGAGLGAIFTKRWVAELVLDLAGYIAAAPLWRDTVIEPACGHGAFVEVIIARLIESCRRDGVELADTAQALIAMDIDPVAVRATRQLAAGLLRSAGLGPEAADALAGTWIREADFLTVAPSLCPARWVVGNPPYVRLEDVSRSDMAVYRGLWSTMSGRADLYVGFYEAGLSLLEPGGRLSYICADRWMRNSYGAGLRAHVRAGYAVEACVVMHAVDAFEERVAAYPAITVLAKTEQAAALVVDASNAFDAAAARRLAEIHARGSSSVVIDDSFRASWLPGWPHGSASWPSGAPEHLTRLSVLEGRLPTLAQTGAVVSVGVATGADDVYVIDDPGLVEPEMRHPTLAARETALGDIAWRNRYLVSPWTSQGLIELDDYPRLRDYLTSHEARLRRRHVAKNNPQRWWRTIDRVDPAVAAKPKLLIPDLKDRVHPVFDDGKFVPLHSLYYITSTRWDLAVLGGLLLSDVANSFVEAYSVRMANGYLRVSAQYLRRVRVPIPEDVSAPVRAELAAAFWERDRLRANRAAGAAYGLDGTPS